MIRPGSNDSSSSKGILAEIRMSLQAAHGSRLKGLVLYGSEARRESKPDSDIDVLVLLEGPIHIWQDLRTSIHALYPLSLKYCRPISPKPVDVRSFNECRYPLYRAAMIEGVRI